MKLKNIEIKATRTVDNENILDLTEPTLVINHSSPDFVVTKVFLVTEQYAMRPDLISLAAYGSDDYVDLILKSNEISNPFSIESGDILAIPAKENASIFYKIPKREESAVENTKDKFIDPTKKSETDDSRLEKIKKIASNKKNKASEIKPPTAKRENESAFVSDGNKVTFSPKKSKRK